jgi:hypothetical protein
MKKLLLGLMLLSSFSAFACIEGKDTYYAVIAKTNVAEPFSFGKTRCVFNYTCDGYLDSFKTKLGDSNFEALIYPNRNGTKVKLLNTESSYSNASVRLSMPAEFSVGDKGAWANGKTVEVEVYETKAEDAAKSSKCEDGSLSKIELKKL